MSMADQMLIAFCFVDDFLQAHFHLVALHTSNNAGPKCSDAEVIPIALMQGIFQVAFLKQAYKWPAIQRSCLPFTKFKGQPKSA